MPWLDTGLIVIGKVGAEHVAVNITDRNSEGWLSGTLEVRAGAWSGCCGVWFHQGELRQFASEVDRPYKDLVGTAQFTPMEPYLELKFTGNGRGLISVEGKAQDLLSEDIYLRFKLELDQTDLPAIASALKAADPT
ncbi:MAG: hypothetical protein LLG20_10305 [Acidobacteriales bacterium]|nr:hypothetical protein [Terriglobales bacterium]